MTRRIIDCVPMHDELDMLEARLLELESVPNLTHVIVEADVTHQGASKPSYYLDNRDRFSQWKDRIVHVWATGLPTVEEAPNAWSRELAQRDHCITGVKLVDPDMDDVILHGDLDEIPRPLFVRNAPLGDGIYSYGMRGHFWAVDYLYPYEWQGTVGCNVRTLTRLGSRPFVEMRNRRNIPADQGCLEPGGWAHGWYMPPGRVMAMRDAGWHLSWLGGAERVAKKLASFCHPEVADRLDDAIADDNRYYREGRHVDGLKLEPVEVDETWPRYVFERRCPKSWWRPR